MISTILLIIEGILNFPSEIMQFIQLLKGTPADQIHEVMGRVQAAFSKADALDPKTGKPADDTSDLEDIINH